MNLDCLIRVGMKIKDASCVSLRAGLAEILIRRLRCINSKVELMEKMQTRIFVCFVTVSVYVSMLNWIFSSLSWSLWMSCQVLLEYIIHMTLPNASRTCMILCMILI